jgi:hypothetical protein
MLTTYLKTPLTLARYRIGPAGPHLERFVETIVICLWARATLSRFWPRRGN